MKKLALAITLALAGCGGAKPRSEQATVPAYSLAGVLVPTEQIHVAPFVVQQRIKGLYRGGEVSIDCVVQWKDGKLTVLGLTPFGTRAFSIEQTGTQVKFEKYVDRDMPVKPEMVLYDIHRVFFRALPSGQRQGQDHGDMITELSAGDYVVERRFQGMEGTTNLVVINFDGPPAPIVAPHVRITNAGYSYTLEIDNSEQKALSDEYTLAVQTEGDPNAEAPPGDAFQPDSNAPVSTDPRVYAPPLTRD
jgi:hypothetical protein